VLLHGDHVSITRKDAGGCRSRDAQAVPCRSAMYQPVHGGTSPPQLGRAISPASLQKDDLDIAPRVLCSRASSVGRCTMPGSRCGRTLDARAEPSAPASPCRTIFRLIRKACNRAGPSAYCAAFAGGSRLVPPNVVRQFCRIPTSELLPCVDALRGEMRKP